jgi:hypothetical protein
MIAINLHLSAIQYYNMDWINPPACTGAANQVKHLAGLLCW